MARDIENPDTKGKDMDMSDTETRRCSESGCLHPAQPDDSKCRNHAE